MLIVLTQMAIADYRNQFIRHLVDVMNDRDMQFKIVVGEEYFEESTKTSKLVLSLDETTVIKNSFSLKENWHFNTFLGGLSLKLIFLYVNLILESFQFGLFCVYVKFLIKKQSFGGMFGQGKVKKAKQKRLET